MQIHATYDILPHTSNARSLSPPRWVDRRYILYTHTRTPLFTRSSLVYFRNRERHALSGGRRTSWWRRQRGNVGPCARFSRNGHATMRGKVCNVSDRFCPRSSSIWSLALLRHSKERKRERRRRKKERKKTLRRALVAPHSRGSNWFAIRVPRIANSLEFLPVQWS